MKNKIVTNIINFLNEKSTAIQASKYNSLTERARYAASALRIDAFKEIASHFKMQITEFQEIYFVSDWSTCSQSSKDGF